MASSDSRIRERAWLFAACATIVAIGITGCTASTGAAEEPGPQTDSGPVSGPVSSAVPDAEPAGSVGPTEQPPLPVVDGKLDETITLSTGFTVALESITAVSVEAETPGDVAGPAVAVVVILTNESNEAQNMDSAVVTLEAADGALGIPTIAGGPSPFHGDLAAQASAEGRYLFMLDPNMDRDVTISVNYAAGEPVAVFIGHTP